MHHYFDYNLNSIDLKSCGLSIIMLRNSHETCYMMSIPKSAEPLDGTIIHSLNDDLKAPLLQNSLTPPKSVISSPCSAFKHESDSPPIADGRSSPASSLSPPLSLLGPGAEIKGKICHPIPSVSTQDDDSPTDSSAEEFGKGENGGRLTFFREGKLLLELSHRTDQGSWFQVKSKTYWPPSTATTAATQHPMRHDTPNTVSDDCSSLNSPWFSEHIRKQFSPRSRFHWVDCFYFCVWGLSKKSKHRFKFRRKARRPFVLTLEPELKFEPPCNKANLHSKSRQTPYNYRDKRKNLNEYMKMLIERSTLISDNKMAIYQSQLVDSKETIHSLFEKVDVQTEAETSAFISPRKRYLRLPESDGEQTIKRKVHAGSNSHLKASSRSHNHNNSSPYSIDSLLSGNDNDQKRGESFLRSLLKPEKASRHKTKPIDPVNIKVEGSSTSDFAFQREKRDVPDYKNFQERFDGLREPDLSRFTHSPSLSMYMNSPYLDPRYTMLHSSSFLPNSSRSSDMASAVAQVAAAAAVGYPLNYLNSLPLAAFSPSPIPSPLLMNSHYPLTSHILRSPTPSRSSPSLTQSPSPKHSPAPPSLPPSSPRISRIGSPRDVASPRDHHWHHPQVVPSPHKASSNRRNSSSPPPPPQDVPLNLSKPKGKS